MEHDRWCCLTCYWKGTFEELSISDYCPNLHCPECNSHDLDPINGRYAVAENYLDHTGAVH